MELRRRLGISQEKLAARLHVSLPTVSRWERGRAKPDPRALHLIERFLEHLGDGYRDLLDRFFGQERQLAFVAAATKARTRRRRSAAGSSSRT